MDEEIDYKQAYEELLNDMIIAKKSVDFFNDELKIGDILKALNGSSSLFSIMPKLTPVITRMMNDNVKMAMKPHVEALQVVWERNKHLLTE
ncbi:MAG: hypothetical protein WC451_05575 [Patescibacteria group bacterium]|jgi:hypothetical protein